MDGTTTPSPGLLGRIRRGEIGGVILFGRNVTTATALRALTKQLRDAATAGGQLPLLIAVDQEGGSIKRIPWAPPTLSPPQMGADGRTSTARSQGAATGTALAGLGINIDLAPVADVPAHSYSIIIQAGADLLVQPLGRVGAHECLRRRAGVRGRPPDDEALPGTRLRHDEHRHDRRHDHARRRLPSTQVSSRTGRPSRTTFPS